MIGRLMNAVMILSLIPAWLVVLSLVTGGLAAVVLLMAVLIGGTTSSVASDLHYQCDSAVGPDPAITVTAAPTTTAESGVRSGSATSASAAPTTNPYAELTIAPDDTSVSEWQRACVSALQSAPYQAAPLQTANTGFVAECAQRLALAQLGPPSGTIEGSSGGLVADLAAMGRSVIYQASAASATGRCDLPAGAGTAIGGPDPEPAVVGQASTTPRTPCGQLTATGGAATAVVVLPNTVAGQASCGQRVDPAAVSAGDLVFWNYRNNAPTRSGIAVSATQVVTVDPATGRKVQEPMPTGRDVRVKRVLGGGS